MDQDTISDIVKFSVSKQIRSLYKECLSIVKETVYNPPKDPFNYDSNLEYTKLRKKILDKGNDCERNIIETIEQFNISLKEKK